jgi:hypothetical protein
MCETESAGIESGQLKQAQAYENAHTKAAEPTLRDRLEQKRNRLTRQLVQVEEALRLIYADPNAEKIFETLRRPAGF